MHFYWSLVITRVGKENRKMLLICLIYFAYMKQKCWLKYLNGKWLSEMSNAHVQKTLVRIRRKLLLSARELAFVRLTKVLPLFALTNSRADSHFAFFNWCFVASLADIVYFAWVIWLIVVFVRVTIHQTIHTSTSISFSILGISISGIRKFAINEKYQQIVGMAQSRE